MSMRINTPRFDAAYPKQKRLPDIILEAFFVCCSFALNNYRVTKVHE